MRLLVLATMCLSMTACGGVSLDVLDDCTQNPLKTVNCLTYKPAKYVVESGNNDFGGSPSADTGSPSSGSKPKISKPPRTWGD